MKQLLPVTVTTYEALCTAVKGKVPLIYVPYEFWCTGRERIHKKLIKYQYRLAELPSSKGFFFIRGDHLEEYCISAPEHLY